MNRPRGYQYFQRLIDHVGHITNIFGQKFIYPRQLEIHLPGNCNFNCFWCQGSELEQPLGKWQEEGLQLLENLKGDIPLHVYGGAYTEPLADKHILKYLETTKKYGNEFGIHTNGSLLYSKETKEGFLTRVMELGDSENDYLSVSLDAGSPESHMKGKGLQKDFFTRIIEGLEIASKIRGNSKYPALRIVYLMNDYNATKKEIENVVEIGERLGLDSIRFSIPYELYGRDFEEVRFYKQVVEVSKNLEFFSLVKPYIIDQHPKSKPFIFWLSPKYQDVDEMNYKQCIYSYFQITLGADGYVYKCSSMASPSFKFCRLGKITSDLKVFNSQVDRNHNLNWKPSICFTHGGRCNRMAIELNNTWRDR